MLSRLSASAAVVTGRTARQGLTAAAAAAAAGSVAVVRRHESQALVTDRIVGDIDLTDVDVEHYNTRGYLKVPQLLSAAQLELWHAAADEALAALTEHELYSRDSEEDSRTNLLSRRVDLWPSSIALHELVNGAKCVIGRMACQLEDCDAIRSYHDRALLQKGYSDALNWTVDLPRWSFDDVHAMSVWIALDDVHMEDGCLHFLRGSHLVMRNTMDGNGRFPEFGYSKHMNSLLRKVPALLDCEPQAIEMQAGDCIFFNALTVHAAGANMTPYDRRAMSIQLMPAGTTFNGKQGFLTKEEFESLKVGDKLDNDERHPLLFSKEGGAVC